MLLQCAGCACVCALPRAAQAEVNIATMRGEVQFTERAGLLTYIPSTTDAPQTERLSPWSGKP